MGCSPPGSSVHGIFQARILEWVAVGWGRLNHLLRDRVCKSSRLLRCGCGVSACELGVGVQPTAGGLWFRFGGDGKALGDAAIVARQCRMCAEMCAIVPRRWHVLPPLEGRMSLRGWACCWEGDGRGLRTAWSEVSEAGGLGSGAQTHVRDRAENGLRSGLMEGFRVRVWAAQLPATASRPFLPVAGGLGHSPSRQRQPRGFGQACSMCILVPSLLHFANAHITRFPWRPASLREGSVEGPSERTQGKEQLGSGRRLTPRREVTWFCCRLQRAFLAPQAGARLSPPRPQKVAGRGCGLHPLTHWRSDTLPEAQGTGGTQASRVPLWWDPDAVCLSCFLPEKWPAGRPPGCVNSHFLAV